MTKKQATDQFQQGAPIMVCEFRSSIPEMINYRDKTTGKAMTMKKLTHNVEVGNLSVAVNERVGDDVDLTQFKPPFPKGTKVVLIFDHFERERGAHKASGKLEPLMD